jgi:hypothetical protein
MQCTARRINRAERKTCPGRSRPHLLLEHFNLADLLLNFAGQVLGRASTSWQSLVLD